MLGNLGEWCQGVSDNYQPDFTGKVVDLLNADLSVDGMSHRVLRGGVFCKHSELIRSAARIWYLPSDVNDDNGFRLARTCP